MQKSQYKFQKKLKQALLLIISNWPILKHCHDTLNQLPDKVIQPLYKFLTQYDINQYYIQQFLDKLFQQQLNFIFDDGSLFQLSKLIMKMLLDIENQKPLNFNMLDIWKDIQIKAEGYKSQQEGMQEQSSQSSIQQQIVQKQQGWIKVLK